MNLSTLGRLKSGVPGVHVRTSDEVTVKQPETAGGIVKDVQGFLRHSRTATTTDVYMQEIPDSARGNGGMPSMPTCDQNQILGGLVQNFLEICYELLPNRKGQSL